MTDVCAGDAAMIHGKSVIKLGSTSGSSVECYVDAANAVVPNVAMRDSGKALPSSPTIRTRVGPSNCLEIQLVDHN